MESKVPMNRRISCDDFAKCFTFSTSVSFFCATEIVEMGRKLLDAAPTASLTQMKESKHLEQMKHFQNIAALCETISDDDGSLLK